MEGSPPNCVTFESEVDVPGPPAGCDAVVRVMVAPTPCVEFAGDETGNGGWVRIEGELSGTPGVCRLMCREGAAQWYIRSDQSGWRGDAVCHAAGVTSPTVHAVDPVAGVVHPAVGVLWLVAGAESFGIAPLDVGAENPEYGVTDGGCPEGQPTRE